MSYGGGIAEVIRQTYPSVRLLSGAGFFIGHNSQEKKRRSDNVKE
jgi:hypothetical protein